MITNQTLDSTYQIGHKPIRNRRRRRRSVISVQWRLKNVTIGKIVPEYFTSNTELRYYCSRPSPYFLTRLFSRERERTGISTLARPENGVYVISSTAKAGEKPGERREEENAAGREMHIVPGGGEVAATGAATWERERKREKEITLVPFITSPENHRADEEMKPISFIETFSPVCLRGSGTYVFVRPSRATDLSRTPRWAN